MEIGSLKNVVKQNIVDFIGISVVDFCVSRPTQSPAKTGGTSNGGIYCKSHFDCGKYFGIMDIFSSVFLTILI
jgi:hypothetical protein